MSAGNLPRARSFLKWSRRFGATAAAQVLAALLRRNMRVAQAADLFHPIEYGHALSRILTARTAAMLATSEGFEVGFNDE